MTLNTTPLEGFIKEQAYQLFEPIKKNYRAVLNALLDSGCYDDDFAVYSFIEEHIQEKLVDPLVSFIRDHIFSPASFHAVDMMKKAGLNLSECLSETAGVADDFIRVHEVKGEQVDLCREALDMAIRHLYEVVQPKAIENGYDVSFNMGDSDSLIYRSDYVSASIALRLPIGVDWDGLCVFASEGNSYLIGDSNIQSNAILLDSSYHKPICAFDNPGDAHMRQHFNSFHDNNMSGTNEVYMKGKEHIYRCICIANKSFEYSSNDIKTGTFEWKKRWGAVVCDSSLLMSVQRSVVAKMTALKKRDADKYNELIGVYDALDMEYYDNSQGTNHPFLRDIFSYGTLSDLVFSGRPTSFNPSWYFKGKFADGDEGLIKEDELRSYLDSMSLKNVLILKDNKVIKIPSKFFGISYPNEITDLFSGGKDADNVVDGLIGVYNLTITATATASNIAMGVNVSNGKVSVNALFENDMYEKHECQIRVDFGGIETRK